MNDVTPDDGVLVLDLRPPPGHPADPAATQRTVQEQLGRARLGGYGPLRLLILDTAVGLTAHTAAYERVMGYPAQSAPQVLCVAVGDVPPAEPPPGEPAGGLTGGLTGAPRAGRRLRLPTVLRTAGAAVLWVSDPQCGAQDPDPQPDPHPNLHPGPHPDRPADRVTAGRRSAVGEAAVALLVELLRPPELFDEVLEKALRCPSATVALSAHVLAYDLPAEARDRAWRAALARFAGDPAAQLTADAAAPVPEDLPRALAELLPGGLVRSPERLLRPGGPVAAERDACARALEAADTAWSDLARPLALLTGKDAAQALPLSVEDASRGLRRYREVVARVLRESGAPGVPPAESAALLDRLGVTPPTAPRSTGRPDRATEEELGAFTLGLLSRGLALHTVAGRLTSLSEQVATVPAAGLATRLDQRCPTDLPGRVGVSHPFGFASAGLGRLAGLGALIALAGLGRWPGTVLAVVPILVLLVGGALAAGRRPNPAVRGPIRQAAGPRTVAVVLGATGAFLLGHLLNPPPWIGVIGAAVAASACLLMVCSDWVRAVDEWCEGTGLAVLRQALDGIDSVLAEAMRQQWWAADERTRCADSARALAVVLRRSATEAHGSRTAHDPTVPGRPDPDAFLPRDDPARAGRTVDGWPADTWSDEDWPEDPWSEAPTGDGPWDEEPWRRPRNGEQPPPTPAPFPPEPPTVHPADDRPASGDAPHWLVHTAADGGPELLPTLVADLADATVDALRRFWGATAPAATAHRAADTLAEAVRDGFGTARRHLERCGVIAVPPFARHDRHRGDAMALLGSGLRPLQDALTPEAADRLRPLCSAAQLPLLSRDPTAMHVIRFAPRAVRTALGTAPAPAPDDAVWMSSGRFVGAIKLTALRPGAVETVRIRVRAADDDKADSGLSHGDSGGATW
ncbi:hypothetical protein [Streptomyces sp900129855]|uniref:Uncharacterized protein n=1 Tax=Streptomyces sp. 900129855 TaxID=3155129 RepID=A0ABV2ZE59_9ACTN